MGILLVTTAIILLLHSVHQVSADKDLFTSFFGSSNEVPEFADNLNKGRQLFGKKYGIIMNDLVWDEGLKKEAEKMTINCSTPFAHGPDYRYSKFRPSDSLPGTLDNDLQLLDKDPQRFFGIMFHTFSGSSASLEALEYLIPQQEKVGCSKFFSCIFAGARPTGICVFGPKRRLNGMTVQMVPPPVTQTYKDNNNPELSPATPSVETTTDGSGWYGTSLLSVFMVILMVF